MKTAGICLVLLLIIPVVSGDQRTLPRSHALSSVAHINSSSLVATAAAFQESAADLARILTNRALWGRDFATALSSIPAWNQSGETTVLVFSDRVMGNEEFEKRKGAETAYILPAAKRRRNRWGQNFRKNLTLRAVETWGFDSYRIYYCT